MNIEQYTDSQGQVQPTCSCYKQTLRQDYSEATDYRIFIRHVDDATREVEHRFFNSYADFEAADNARYALRRDETRYLFVCPCDADPASAGRASKREQQDIIRADIEQAQREERGL